MPGSEFSSEFRYGVQPSGCTDFEQAKACTPCLVRRSAQSSGMEFSLQAALSLSRLKPELHAWFGGQHRSSGLEFSLQAALSLSRLKPELHACFGGQHRVQVWSSAFRLH